MEQLNLPPFEYRVKSENNIQYIRDEFRQKYVKLNPEEWVRQHFMHYLVNELSYPSGLMSVEKELKLGSLRRRPDLIVYNKNAVPVLLAEFKAPNIDIDEDVFFQIAMYNKKLQVPYLVMSNGLIHYCAKIQTDTGKLEFLDTVPLYKEL